MESNPTFLSRGGDDISPDIEKLEAPEGEPYLRFFLPSGNELALPATGIREVMNQSPERITPIPNASPLLLGTINLRGQVIWVADLGQFLGDTSALNTQRSELPIVAVEDQEIILGLAIDRIGDMDWLSVDKIQASTSVPDNMAAFILGEWNLDEADERKLQLLNPVAVLRSARWAA